MRISDWSSDVCASDLPTLRVGGPPPGPLPPRVAAPDVDFVRGFNDWSAHVGLIYRLGDVRLHASVSRRAEAPILEDLITVSGGTFNSGPTGIQANPLQSQTADDIELRSEEHTSALQYLMRISYAILCLKK